MIFFFSVFSPYSSFFQSFILTFFLSLSLPPFLSFLHRIFFYCRKHTLLLKSQCFYIYIFFSSIRHQFFFFFFLKIQNPSRFFFSVFFFFFFARFFARSFSRTLCFSFSFLLLSFVSCETKPVPCSF